MLMSTSFGILSHTVYLPQNPVNAGKDLLNQFRYVCQSVVQIVKVRFCTHTAHTVLEVPHTTW